LPDDPKRVVIVNEDEPRTGDYAYNFYDNTHPVNGDAAEIARMRRALRGLRDKDVTLTFRGNWQDDNGVEHNFRVRRTFQLHTYRDAFGPGSAYASAIRYVRDKHSDNVINIVSFVIEESEPGDQDSEE
jgi:hypothetical protein